MTVGLHHNLPQPLRVRFAVLVERPEYPRHLADQIVHRHESDRRHHAAVTRVVAIVAEHEEMARRHGVDVGVVVVAVVDTVLRHVGRAIRQRLAPALGLRTVIHAAGGAGECLLQSDARHGAVVEDELALPHLDAITGQPDHALDIVDRGVL
ncbi:MoxR-like ATPase [Bradyrhizobium sp. GM2.4]